MTNHLISRSRFLDALVLDADNKTDLIQVHQALEKAVISPDEVRGVGKWIRISGFHLDHEYHPARYQCDQCKHFVDSGDDRNYCPSCGARMKGDTNGTTD